MPVCDVCNSNMSWENGYVLTTMQVATSDAYWESVFKGPWSYTHNMDPDGDTVAALVKQQAGQSSGWLVCETCSALFSFDRAQARTYARAQNAHPPGTGSAPAELAAIAAANVWRRLYGKWPSSIQSAPVQAGSSAAASKRSTKHKCDFCGRLLYADEQVAMLDEVALQKMEALGGLRRSGSAPVRDPAGKLRWVACSSCMGAATRAAKTVLETGSAKKWWQFWR